MTRSERSEERFVAAQQFNWCLTFALFESKKTSLWLSAGLIELGEIECWNTALAYQYNMTLKPPTHSHSARNSEQMCRQLGLQT